MREHSNIDLSQLPAPQLIEALDAESYIAAAIADYQARYPDFTAVLESEPVLKFIEVLAYRETLMRNRVNQAARGTLLAFAIGSDLDHIGALFAVSRMIDDEGNREDDERLRRRIQLAPESFSVAGPPGAYEFHALTTSLDIFDAHAYSPAPGQVTVAVAGAVEGSVSDQVLMAVFDRVTRDDTAPLTDMVTVRRAARLDYPVAATLRLRRGPDPAAVKALAESRLAAYAGGRYRIGMTVYRAGLTAALQAAGVENVVLTQPAADIVCGPDEIAMRAQASITVEVS